MRVDRRATVRRYDHYPVPDPAPGVGVRYDYPMFLAQAPELEIIRPAIRHAPPNPATVISVDSAFDPASMTARSRVGADATVAMTRARTPPRFGCRG